MTPGEIEDTRLEAHERSERPLTEQEAELLEMEEVE